jgi:hypothetical protein
MYLLAINLSRLIANTAWIALIIIVFIILYRLLLRKLKSNRPSEENYLILHPIEKENASGKIQVFFEQTKPKKVSISIYSEDESVRKTLIEKDFPAGGNVINIDTTNFPNGTYFLEAKTAFQKTSKVIQILN